MHYQRDENMLLTLMGDELVALDASRGIYHHLNISGRAIWEALDVPRSFEQLLGVLRSRYADSQGSMEQDTARFLEQLIAKGIVRANDQQAA